MNKQAIFLGYPAQRISKSEAWLLAIKAAVTARPDKQIILGCSNPISMIETLKHRLTDVPCEIISPCEIKLKARG